jgi:hypothetical protein
MRPLTKREKIIAALCQVLIFSFLVKEILFSSILPLGEGLEDRVGIMEQKIAKTKAIIQRRDVYDRQLNAFEKMLGLASSEGVEMSDMAGRIGSAARQVNVKVSNIQPLKPREEKYFQIFPVEVTLDGEWPGLAKFIYLMQSQENSFGVEEADLEKYDTNTAALRGRLVLTRVRLKKAE